VEEAGVSSENHRPWESNWQTLSLAPKRLTSENKITVLIMEEICNVFNK